MLIGQFRFQPLAWRTYGGNRKGESSNRCARLFSDEICLFEVPDWIPQAKVNPKGGFTPLTPVEIEKPTGVTWEIKDKSKKNIFLNGGWVSMDLRGAVEFFPSRIQNFV